MDQVHEPQIPAIPESHTVAKKRKKGGKKHAKMLSLAADLAREKEAARKARGKFKVEQSQNLRWLRVQPGLSTTALEELECYFGTNERSMQSAIQLLSDEIQALVRRLQDERREAIERKTYGGVSLRDWFKKRTATPEQQQKDDIRNELSDLMDRTTFFMEVTTKRRHRKKVQKRLEYRMKRFKAVEDAEKAARDAAEHTETFAHVMHGLDEMCLKGE